MENEYLPAELEHAESANLGNCVVHLSNALIRAGHALTLIEKRVVSAAVATVDSRKGFKQHAHLAPFTKLRITAAEYAETFEVDEKHAYEHLKKAADHLFERYVSIKQPAKRGERIIKFRWVSSVTYAQGEGFIELSFTPEVYPHLHALSGTYTRYKLRNAAALRSIYSWRLYELAKSWLTYSTEGKPLRINLTNLRNTLEVPEKYKWDDMRKRAIDPAIAEIAQHAGLQISYTVIKTGRTITALDMSVTEISQMNLPLTE